MILTAIQISAQEPPWILLERAKTAYESRNLTLAMEMLLDAVEQENDYPEAEFWLGRIYEAQGQSVLAEEQYRRALNLSLYLRVPEDAVIYRYALAELIMQQDSDGRLEAETILNRIINDETPPGEAEIALDHKYIDLVSSQGLDELIYLYRNEIHSSLRARRMLGESAWASGRYRTSLLQSTRCVLSMLSTAAADYRDRYPTWRFDIDLVEDAKNPDRDVRYPGQTDGTSDLLDRISQERPGTAEWLISEGFWPQLYMLATSLFAMGFEDGADSVWGIMVEKDPLTGRTTGRDDAGSWGLLAVRQLENPFISVGSLAP
jgi:tetratricopeptide (TPR) repeat protein